MNSDHSGSCPLSPCQDYCGTLPSCAGLAVPYVPFQQNDPKQYSQMEALSSGTLFPGLDLPFHLAVEGSKLPSGPLTQLQAMEFVVLELGLYLDTHPDDAEAFALFQQLSALERAARAEYERQNGPLTKDSATGDRFRWLNDPWPWNYPHSEVN